MSNQISALLISQYLDGEIAPNDAGRVAKALRVDATVHSRFQALKRRDAIFLTTQLGKDCQQGTGNFFASSLYLVCVEGRSYQQVADLQACPVEEIQQKVLTARYALAKELREEL